MKIGFLLFPNVTQLDAMGPLQFLSRMPGAEVITISKMGQPIETDCPVKLVATHNFDNAPDLDLICVPGGFGTVEAIGDSETLDFVRAQGSKAEYITSVCTGALILGAAGLLTGKKATTHWAYTDLLSLFGATHEDSRVVQDGNTFTGGGVTAGIDFALTVIGAIKGEKIAQGLQLGLEYNPAPPFNAGSLATAPADVSDRLTQFYASSLETSKSAITASIRKRGGKL